MVAIVTGNALGLNTSSLAVLGQRGSTGSATTGRNGDMAYVNAATGNLVLQTRDEMLVGRGLSIESVRTYNSRGQFTDDNGDNWSMGVYAQQLKLNGTLGVAGSTFVRTDRDGSQATYTYEQHQYLNKDGAGAFDRISATSTSRTWTDGATGVKETYDPATGRLVSVIDPSGNRLAYGYDEATGRLIHTSTMATDCGR
jgi:YD repeat-containing protein